MNQNAKISNPARSVLWPTHTLDDLDDSSTMTRDRTAPWLPPQSIFERKKVQN